MIVHDIETKEPKSRKIKVGTDEHVRTYRCLKDGLEFAGYTLKKGDQVVSSEPMCGKGTSLVNLSPEAIKKGQTPAFELVQKMVPKREKPEEPDDDEDETKNPFLREDDDPRSKPKICNDIYQNFGEKINPVRIKRKDLLALEQKYILERDKDALTAVTDEVE